MGVVCLYLNLQNQKFASYYAAQHLSSIAHEPVRIQRLVLRNITFLIWTTICNAAMITISIIASTKLRPVVTWEKDVLLYLLKSAFYLTPVNHNNNNNNNLVWRHCHRDALYKLLHKLKSASHVSLTYQPHPFLQGAFHLTQPHPHARKRKHGRSLTVMPWTKSNHGIAFALRLGPTQPVTDFWGWQMISS